MLLADTIKQVLDILGKSTNVTVEITGISYNVATQVTTIESVSISLGNKAVVKIPLKEGE